MTGISCGKGVRGCKRKGVNAPKPGVGAYKHIKSLEIPSTVVDCMVLVVMRTKMRTKKQLCCDV